MIFLGGMVESYQNFKIQKKILNKLHFENDQNKLSYFLISHE